MTKKASSPSAGQHTKWSIRLSIVPDFNSLNFGKVRVGYAYGRFNGSEFYGPPTPADQELLYVVSN